jgi:cell division protein FtsI/penicillin-binding protein 2
MKQPSFQSRIRIVAVCVFLVAVVFIVRLFSLQVVNNKFYAEKADRQYITPSGNVFNRGDIFFSKKDGSLVSAASVTTGFKIAINPKEIKEEKEIFEKLSPYLKMDEETFLVKASRKDDPYEEIATGLTKEQITEIESLKIKGLSTFKQNWRNYPSGNLAAHTIGFLAYKGDDLIGQYGLERYYNDVLSKPKNESYVNFFAEVFSNIKETLSDTAKGDIVTTIEPIVEHELQKELISIMETWTADQAGGIIINPINGEIYAAAGLPDFDLNNFKEVKNIGVYRNPLIENVFEFGSVIKPLVIAAGLDAGVITPKTEYYDAGSVVVDKKVINNFDKKGRGTVTIQDVLNQSLNTGMVFAEQKLGHERFRNYMKSYGIGEKTGIDLPNETSGLIRNLESPRNIEYANASFGQGIAITPIEAVRAFSILANGGNMITPHLVKEIKYENGLSKKMEYPYTKTNILGKEATDTITEMLIKVYEAYDSGRHKIPNYTVATKTGTAQVAKETGGGYYDDRNMHSFFGYFPARDPKFLIFIYVKNPRGVKYASQTLIPPFNSLAKFLINYYNLPPDR